MSYAKEIDVRTLPAGQCHGTIVSSFEQLAPGEKMLLTVHHDPKPLQYEFQAERAGHFNWVYLEQGPEVWRVEVGKV